MQAGQIFDQKLQFNPGFQQLSRKHPLSFHRLFNFEPVNKRSMSHKILTSTHVLIPKSKDRALKPGLLSRLFWFHTAGKTAVQYSGHRNRIRTYGAPVRVKWIRRAEYLGELLKRTFSI
ncbi:hypothetical protein EGT74_23655 [Chitinophaga lutea]|uniref:Uncharacterized protein n=1 Tax=Chitinophaga lutea TaxID=2488634 RepID=A0A3N4PAW0_9BACT|nr:hypothetical protein EGT74_23655 [Chitinophaga lutea]